MLNFAFLLTFSLTLNTGNQKPECTSITRLSEVSLSARPIGGLNRMEGGNPVASDLVLFPNQLLKIVARPYALGRDLNRVIVKT